MRKARFTIIRLVPIIALLIASGSSPAHAVVYGDDDRVDVYQNADPVIQTMVDSVAALVMTTSIDDSDPSDVRLDSGTLGESLGLCDDERFYSQPDPCFCSATLIDSDLVLTAGHCVEDAGDCTGTSFVFDYHMMDSDNLAPLTIDDIFHCDELVAHEQTPVGDFSIVRLDRNVIGVEPSPFFRGDLFEYSPAGGELVVIGHPTGLPTKIADNGWVRGDSSESYFQANLDVNGGNSGSGVLSLFTAEVVGILVRGETDYVYDSDRDCYMTNQCDDDLGCDPPLGTGFEHVMRSSLFAHWIPERCGDGLCDPGEDDASCPEDCPQDSDYDSVPDIFDNCSRLPNVLQENFDSDGFGDACDCDPTDPTIWSRPSELGPLTVFHDRPTGLTLLSWDPPLEHGALSVVYDTLRSELPFDFMVAHCLESDDGFDLSAEDGDWLPPGMAYYYLVRAQNSCPDGEGSLGVDWRFRPRVSRPCP